MNSLERQGRAAGAVVGSAVGDALGAPFEFGPAGVYTAAVTRGTPPPHCTSRSTAGPRATVH